MLKSLEAAGFAWLQIHTPPRSVLADEGRTARHAEALRRILDSTRLRLILHGPGDLSAGEPAHDAALDGLIRYAARTRAELVVYHGANFPLADGGAAAARVHDRLGCEESSLRARARTLERLGITLAIENLAPVWPGPPYLSHSPGFIHDLVARLDSPRIRMLLDVGHANIAAGLAGGDVRRMLESVQDAVGLFHVHDNLGARRSPVVPVGLGPLRLDLHLPPGSGRVPWEDLAGALLDHDAPLMLEVHPPHRPEPLSLRTVTTELLLRRRLPVDGARSVVTGDPRFESAVPLG